MNVHTYKQLLMLYRRDSRNIPRHPNRPREHRHRPIILGCRAYKLPRRLTIAARAVPSFGPATSQTPRQPLRVGTAHLVSLGVIRVKELCYSHAFYRFNTSNSPVWPRIRSTDDAVHNRNTPRGPHRLRGHRGGLVLLKLRAYAHAGLVTAARTIRA